MYMLPIARILLRYLSGAAVSLGLLSPQLGTGILASEESAMIVAGLLGIGVTEAGYYIAKRRGGAT
ncbi:hypothetical protein [Poseidonocella sp. HB161398]|uniref:hypothetical protein n=1 Tax=Poseidonocella sp. HB161398 TaxID=2320855 RepID=UPI001107C259|nr:hypothetical protein [Poseidonocella sp. HB161398]